MRRCLVVLALALWACRSEAPRLEARRMRAPSPVAPAPPQAAAAQPVAAVPAAFAGNVLTDVHDVRACLPLPSGQVIAATGGGVWLTGADGSTQSVWTALEGLPETRAHTLLRQGSELWIGTEGGVAQMRLEGGTAKLERAVSGPSVRAIAVHEGALFAATWGEGIVKIARSGASLELRPVARDGAEGRFTALATSGGKLYAASMKSLFVVSGRSLKKVESADLPAPVWALSGAGDRLWAGGLTGLVALVDGRVEREGGSDVRALAPGDKGPLVGTFGRGALEFDGGRLASLPDLDGRARFARAVGAEGADRCVGTPEGLFVQRGRSAPWVEQRAPHLGSNDIAAIAADGERLYLGTFDRGLWVLERGISHRIDHEHIDAKVNGLAVEHTGGGTRLWVATARGLTRVDAGQGGIDALRFTQADGLPSNDVHAVVALKAGGVLVGTSAGGAIVSDEGVTNLGEKRGVPRVGVWAVAEAADGKLLLGTSRGLLVGSREASSVIGRTDPALAQAAEKAWTQLSMATGDLADDWVTALAVKGSVVHVGTYNAGVTRIDLRAPAEARHLGGGYVNFGGLTLKGTTLYAATMSGLLARSANGEGAWRTVGDAAPGRDVTQVVFAKERMWVASRRGIAVRPARM